jgi:hypothetical protein
MKKGLIFLIVILLLICTSCTPKPYYSAGYPLFEIFPLEERDVEVVSEKIDFDINDSFNKDWDANYQGYCPGITSSYEIKNIRNEVTEIQMALPLIPYDRYVWPVEIELNGNQVEYLEHYGENIANMGPDDKFLDKMNLEDILIEEDYPAYKHITEEIDEQPYENGTLYRIKKPDIDAGEKSLFFYVRFKLDKNKTKVITYGLDHFEDHEDGYMTLSWDSYEGSDEIGFYVMGEPIEFNKHIYLGSTVDGEIDESNLVINSETLDLKTIFNTLTQKYTYATAKKMAIDMKQDLLAEGIVDFSDVLTNNTVSRIKTLLFKLKLDPGSTNKLTVNCRMKGTMDNKSKDTQIFTFEYHRDSINNWEHSGPLTLEVNPPERAPNMVDSNVEFKKDGSKFVAQIKTPSKDNIFFTLSYEKEVHDKNNDKLLSGIFDITKLAILIVISIVTGVLISVLYLLVTKKSEKY